jgi:hypothetical protein
MENREEYLERFRIDNEKMLSETANRIQDQLGDKSEKLNDLLKDKRKLSNMVNGLSDADFNRLKQVLDNPQIVEKVLSSDKAKKNLAKLLGEL